MAGFSLHSHMELSSEVYELPSQASAAAASSPGHRASLPLCDFPNATAMSAWHPPSSSLTLPSESYPFQSSEPRYADYDARHFIVSGGVAIFHLATSRVVLCWHSRDRYWFLPKGRRDTGEDSGAGAEREGYEESGYRNRLLPLPINHKQPAPSVLTVPLDPKPGSPTVTPLPKDVTSSLESVYSTEPILTHFLLASRKTQYFLQWYIAETLPEDEEKHANAVVKEAAVTRELDERLIYVRPPPWPKGLTLHARVKLDRTKGDVYQPIRHENTGVDEEEALYESKLVPVDEAIRRLSKSGMDYVVRWGWEAICRRWEQEATLASEQNNA